MNTLNHDVQILLLSYLQPEDIIVFYETYPLIIEELKSHIGFVVKCLSNVSEEIIQWFQQHTIRLELLQSYIQTDIGDQFWYQNGCLHRDNDEPAVIWNNSTNYKLWYQYGRLHRDNDLPAITSTVQREWYQNGRLHRDHDQPAVIRYNKPNQWYWKEYYQHGLLHRENDFPAIMQRNGCYTWARHGKRYVTDRTILLQKMKFFSSSRE